MSRRRQFILLRLVVTLATLGAIFSSVVTGAAFAQPRTLQAAPETATAEPSPPPAPSASGFAPTDVAPPPPGPSSTASPPSATPTQERRTAIAGDDDSDDDSAGGQDDQRANPAALPDTGAHRGDGWLWAMLALAGWLIAAGGLLKLRRLDREM